MAGLTRIGEAPWTREHMLGRLDEFASLYERRPIRNNEGGMRAPHLFAFWFALTALRPKVVIESGVWRGQGTWLIEQAVPAARIISIDMDFSNLLFRSQRAEYSGVDFAAADWSGLPKAETLVFFDDHMNAVQRVKDAHRCGFRHLMFEDNYFPPERGDCYSLKMAFAHAGYRPPRSFRALAGRLFKRGGQDPAVRPNAHDDADLRKLVEVYEELPPVAKAATTRWGDPWEESRYPTAEPLLRSIEKRSQQIYFDEAQSYTWMAYVRLK
jgi:hypothetical protein